jgi:hypothetical protein
MAEEVGEGILDRHKMRLFEWFQMKDVTILAGVKYEEITKDGLVLETREGERQLIKADTIIPIALNSTNTELLTTLSRLVPDVYPIGDCREPGLIVDAVADGSRVGRII